MRKISKLPKISVKTSKKGEVKLFLKFLNHPEFPQHRQMILKTFPDLKVLLESSKNEKNAVQEFIDQFYLKNQSTIALAIHDSKIRMKSSQKAMESLGIAMDYHWQSGIDYIAMPTILPFSPFGKNTFNFSILDRITGSGKRDILSTAIHEISHFVFLNYLKKIEKKENISISQDTRYYAKEVLTAALFNEEPIRGVLEIVEYKGNPDIRDIYITDDLKVTTTLINYTRKQYLENIKDGKEFKEFLINFIKTMHKISENLSKKRQIWNRFGNELYKNKAILLQYQMPIQFK